jgi:small subunit ribosomal protein S8
MIIRIKNAVLVKKQTVFVLRSKLVISILNVLKKEGFIDSFEECGLLLKSSNSYYYKYVSINLKYKGSKQRPYITNIKRISKPGYRVYLNYKSIPKILGGVGVAVFVQ